MAAPPFKPNSNTLKVKIPRSGPELFLNHRFDEIMSVFMSVIWRQKTKPQEALEFVIIDDQPDNGSKLPVRPPDVNDPSGPMDKKTPRKQQNICLQFKIKKKKRL